MKESLGYPYVEPKIKNTKQRPTTISLNISQTTSDKGAAVAIALHQHSNAIPPYDYIVDDETVIECSKTLGRTIRVLICAQPHEREPLWEDAVARPVIYRAAYVVAELAHVYNIRLRYIDRDAPRFKFQGGIINQVLGSFPSQAFLQDAKSKQALLRGRKGP